MFDILILPKVFNTKCSVSIEIAFIVINYCIFLRTSTLEKWVLNHFGKFEKKKTCSNCIALSRKVPKNGLSVFPKTPRILVHFIFRELEVLLTFSGWKYTHSTFQGLQNRKF